MLIKVVTAKSGDKRSSSIYGWQDVQVTKVTATTFSVSQYDLVFAVKVAGSGAYKIVKGFYCTSGTGIAEFDNSDSDWNVYKGSASANTWKADGALIISFENTNTQIAAALAEGAEGDFATEVSGWPFAFNLNN